MPAVIERRAAPSIHSMPVSVWVGIAVGVAVILTLLCVTIHCVCTRKRARIPTFTMARSSQHLNQHVEATLTFLPNPRSNKVAPWPEPVDYPDSAKLPSFPLNSYPQGEFKPVLVLTPPSPAYRRQSRRSFGSLLSIASSKQGYSSDRQKKIYRSFDPLLPDELAVTIGEPVMLIHSYSDGWCVVGRDGLDGEMEVGAVPAWCFAKPAAGVSWVRDARVESLGAQVHKRGKRT